MPVAVVFRCEVCGRRPGPETQASLERQLLDLRHGEYVDAEPERWLVWHGRGIYGRTLLRLRQPPRRAEGARCASCTARSAGIPWAMGPHPWRGRRGTDRARALQRSARGGFAR